MGNYDNGHQTSFAMVVLYQNLKRIVTVVCLTVVCFEHKIILHVDDQDMHACCTNFDHTEKKKQTPSLPDSFNFEDE